MNITRESIFISALRGFFNTFAVIIGIAVAFMAIVLCISFFSDSVSTPNRSQLKVDADANWNRTLLPSTAPVILKINLSGVIGLGKLKEDKFKDMLIDSRTGPLANSRVKGILLDVNTPGGTVTDSAAIYRHLLKYKEKFKVPVYAYVDGLCASGGMYICSAADQIFATQDSMIGSVGVRLGPTFNLSEVMSKVGVQALTLTEGKDKDALNPFRPWREGEEQPIRDILAEEYQQFLNVVTNGRKQVDKDALINEYGANIFIARKAQEIGFIDNGNADYDETLTALVKAAGIKEDEKYQVLEVEPFQSLLSGLTDKNSTMFQGKLKHVFPTGSYTTSEMSGQLLYLYQP